MDESTSNIAGSPKDEDSAKTIIDEINSAGNDIDKYIESLSLSPAEQNSCPPDMAETIEIYAKLVQPEMEAYISGSCKIGEDPNKDATLGDFASRIAKLSDLFVDYSREENGLSQMNSSLQQTMIVMEEELRGIIEEFNPQPAPATTTSPKAKHFTSFHSYHIRRQMDSEANANNSNPDQDSNPSEDEDFVVIQDDVVARMIAIVNVMISAGYETECCQVYSVLRRNTFKDAMKRKGFQKLGVDEVKRMNWEQLEPEIVRWIKVVKHTANVLLPREHELCYRVFCDHSSIAEGIMTNLIRGVIILFLNFVEGIATSRLATEALFRVLEICEALTELMGAMANITLPDEIVNEFESEVSTARHKLGEVVVNVFLDLENSIKSDVPKNTVPSGAVHPVTRYTMNYLRYACDYRDTLERIFEGHAKSDDDQIEEGLGEERHKSSKRSPFGAQLVSTMEALDENLDVKSKLYKDPSLRCIFLMNNGRYIHQKIKESSGMQELVGNIWIRRRSTKLRSYHKNYQRETWSKVLQFLNQEGLQVNGKVNKPLLKETFKNFNQTFDEIYKTQSMWVVSDEQLQSELRVSISAVVIPAYRAFMARFGQYFTHGRERERYVKYQPEDIEASIEKLFDGNPSSISRGRR